MIEKQVVVLKHCAQNAHDNKNEGCASHVNSDGLVSMSATGLKNLCNLLAKHEQWSAKRSIFEHFFVFYTSSSNNGHQRVWVSKNTKHKNVRALIESLCFHFEQSNCGYKYKEFEACSVNEGAKHPHVHVFEIDFENTSVNGLLGIVEPQDSLAKSFCGEMILSEFELPSVLYSFEDLTFFAPALCTKSKTGACSV